MTLDRVRCAGRAKQRLAGILAAMTWAAIGAAQAPAELDESSQADALPGAAVAQQSQGGTTATAPVATATAEGEAAAPDDSALSSEVDALPDEPEDEVVVFAERLRRTPGSVQVVGAETLQRYKYDDPHATLQLVPGVYVRQEDGLGLRPNIGIRGAISDRSQKVALMEDGVLFGPAPYSAPAAYYFPIMARMQQMQVMKGPAAIKYGPQTLGGAIDLVTRTAVPGRRGGIDVAAGEYAYGKVHGYYGAGDAEDAFVLEGVHLRSDGFKELPSGDETGFFRNEWMLRGTHSFAPASDLTHRVSLKLTYSDEQSDETYLGLSDQDFRQNPLRRYGPSEADRMRWHRTSIALSHEIEPTYWLSITTTAYRHDLFRIWGKVNHFAGASLFNVLTNPGAADAAQFLSILRGNADTEGEAQQLYVGPNQREYVSQGLQSRAELSFDTGSLSHRLELGLRLHYDRIQRRHSEDAFLVVGGELVTAGSPTVLTTLNRADTYALSAHAAGETRWGRFTVTPGVRLEAIASSFTDHLSGVESDRTLFALLGGAGLHYALSEELGLLAGVHRGMSPPPPGSDEGINPEVSINYEAGARFGAGSHKAELIGYFNDYENLTDICTLSSGCDDVNLDRQFDAGRARIYGVEALAETALELSALRIPLSVNYTLTLTEFLETFESQDPIFGEVEAGDELPYVPKHQGRASLGVDLAAAKAYVAANYASRMREQSGSGPLDLTLATEAQLTFDAGASYQVTRQLELYAQVRNLFNEQYIASRRPYGARPNPPRWIQAGARFAFE